MSTLNIRLGVSPNLPPSTPVSIELTDADLNTRQVTLMGHDATSISVQPGIHLVRARFPSGAEASATTVVPIEGTSEVELTFPHAPQEWLSWPQYLGIAGWEHSGATLDRFPPTWLRLWSAPQAVPALDAEEGTVSWIPMLRVESASTLQYRPENDSAALIFSRHILPAQPIRPRMLQIGGEDVPWRLVSLPPSNGEVQILVRPTSVPTPRDGGVTVKVVTMDANAEALLHYLTSGDSPAAQGISETLIADIDTTAATFGKALPGSTPALTDAEQMLRDKTVNPMGAAVGGYFLLRVGALQRLHDWPNNFANWIDWLPDAAIIHAWQLLRTEGVGQRARQRQARARLLQAARRGLPSYTVGVRLLIDGLELFSGKTADQEVKEALQTIRAYAAAMEWSQSVTTFYGGEPMSPSLELITGVPPEAAQLDWCKA